MAAISLSGKLVVDANTVDAQYSPDGAYYWESVEAFKAAKEEDFSEPLPYTTILAKDSDGVVKEFINKNEADVWEFTVKTASGSSVDIDTEVPATGEESDEHVMSTKLSLTELAKKEDKLILGYGIEQLGDGTLRVDPTKCLELEAEIEGQTGPKVYKLFAFEMN